MNPGSLGEEERNSIIRRDQSAAASKSFFHLYFLWHALSYFHKDFRFIDEKTEVLLVTGIANPQAFETFLEERIQTYYMMSL